jgi:hypothetical protein
LNIYDFHRIQHGPNKGGYVHRCLVKGNPELCHTIVRLYGPPSKPRKKKVDTDKAKKGNNSNYHPICGKITNPTTTQCEKEGLDLLTAASSCSEYSQPPAWMTPSLLADCLPTPINESIMNMRSGYANSGLVGSFERKIPNSTLQESAASDGSNPHKIQVFGEKGFFLNNPSSAVSLTSFGNSISSFKWSTSGLEDFFKDMAEPSSSCGEEQQDFPTLSVRDDGGSRNAPFELASLQPPSSEHLKSSSRLAANATITSAGTRSLVDCRPGRSISLMPTPEDMLGLARPPTSPLASSFPLLAALGKNEDLNRSETVFPAKLHRLLRDAPKNGLSHIVSWIQGGTAFQIHNIDEFTSRVMSTYFSQSKFASFRRQLNLYGFSKSHPSEAVKGTYYYHESFLQNDPSLLHQIVRPTTPPRRKITDELH